MKNNWRRIIVAVPLIGVCIFLIWFSGNPSRMKNFALPQAEQKNQMQNTQIGGNTGYQFQQVAQEERHNEDTRHESSQNVWSKRAAELQAGCKFGQVERAMPRQDNWRGKLESTLIVNDRYKFLFCMVPNIASTTIEKVLATLDGNSVNRSAIDKTIAVFSREGTFLRHLNTYSDKEREFRLQTYKKVMFVREPLERILSAYRTRFGGTLSDDTAFLTFPEFVKYIQDATVEMKQLNIRWRRVFDVCFPCQVHYDVIGKYETIHEDMRLFLKEVGAADEILFPNKSTIYHTPKTSDLMSDYYKKISLTQIKSLWNFYYVDAVPFGYKLPQNLGRLNSTN